ncbi:DUF937 domain-containing protein [Aestuariimicrobium soli]|uniref:DUF937 domain-containing protein n=1 Tax=Aestuariimicrobium soli TaxID=2035834 RepID=UPI003EB8D42E
MSDLNDLLTSLPIDQIANQLGEDPADVRAAAAQALPQLVGGLQANAQEPEGAQSLASALGDHDSSLIDGGIDLDDVDTGDGAKIARHILGDVGGESLVKKLIPILAPIVMAWLVKQVQNRGGAPTAGADAQDAEASSGGVGGVLGDILGRVLGGGAGQSSSGGMQQVLLDILGQALRGR